MSLRKRMNMPAMQNPSPRELLGTTSCAECNEKIAAGEYRVVLMAVEMKPEEYDGDKRRCNLVEFLQCLLSRDGDICSAHVWHRICESAARPSAGPQSEDASSRWTSHRGMAEARARRSDDETLSVQDY